MTKTSDSPLEIISPKKFLTIQSPSRPPLEFFWNTRLDGREGWNCIIPGITQTQNSAPGSEHTTKGLILFCVQNAGHSKNVC